MTTVFHEPPVVSATPAVGHEAVDDRFVARRPAVDWPATRQSHREAFGRLMGPPFVLENAGSQKQRRQGLELLLAWLADQPGESWQQRWLASGADTAGTDWRRIPAQWLYDRGLYSEGRNALLCAALTVVICADIVRPSLLWFVASVTRGGALARCMARIRDGEGFARLRELCDRDPHASAAAQGHSVHRAAVIIAAKGGAIADITIGDTLELLDAETNTHSRPMVHGTAFYQMLHQMGVFGPSAPRRLRELRSTRQRTPEELIDRYHLACRPVRDLLVDYLRERQPALDYSSLRRLAADLGNVFWKDLERHYQGIDSLHLPTEVAQAWKQRLRTRPKTVLTDTGEKTVITVERIGYRQCLTPVRAFYLDLAHWAIEDPSRWGRWVVPCPIGEEEINQRKAARHRKSRMDARTRERLPVLPVLVRTVDERRKTTEVLLHAARQTRPGDTFTTAGQTLTRSIIARPTATEKIWVDDPITGKRRDLGVEEDLAFWAWAAVEVLRHAGCFSRG
jgi:hypothetical protein